MNGGHAVSVGDPTIKGNLSVERYARNTRMTISPRTCEFVVDPLSGEVYATPAGANTPSDRSETT